MPDGDRIHPRLLPCYNRAYQKLCLPNCNMDAVAQELTTQMRKLLYGNEEALLKLIKGVAKSFSSGQTLFDNNLDWTIGTFREHVRKTMYEIQYDLKIKPRLYAILQEAIYSINPECLSSIGSNTIASTILDRFFTKMLHANFIACIPIGSKNKSVLTSIEWQNRFNALESQVAPYSHVLGKYLFEHNSVKHFRIKTTYMTTQQLNINTPISMLNGI